MNRLEGKVAVITGCSHGMGLRAAQLFADEGAKVLATSWNMENLEKNLAGYSENIVLFQLDVREEDQWASAAAKAEELWGKIDILVNNAGLSAKCDLLKETLEGWEAGLRMNLTSQFLGIKTVIPYMQKNGKGSIINCSSLTALKGSMDAGAPAYCSAKAGLRALTRHVAYNFAKDNIRCNIVYPGSVYTNAVAKYGVSFEQMAASPFATKFHPLPPYLGEADDMAYAYLYLASDEAKWITGVDFPVDGGANIC
ncbi:MAG: SDR family oxidoreductase [Firmicutes bacterium]|jgi:NAD(P)-dependent dehydrogenase (short-subunit alcohol dehydrogenase family)|nr:SDR family oxidoreductase [Bacillota bacterium]